MIHRTDNAAVGVPEDCDKTVNRYLYIGFGGRWNPNIEELSMHRLSYRLLILFTVLATLGGQLTLLPRAAASYPNLIGYSSRACHASSGPLS